MIEKHIIEIITEKLKHTPTSDQQKLLSVTAEFLIQMKEGRVDGEDSLLLIKGYAGTGKTSVVSAIVNSLPALRLKSVLLAPTGRASKVLSVYSGKQASTIHKKIYRQKSNSDGIGEFVIDKNLHKNTLFIVDEASMISNSLSDSSVFGSGRVLDDLLEYVYSGVNCRLVLVGDTAQLPPVRLDVSPALDAEVLVSMGFVIQEVEMKEVVRQKNKSGILNNATLIREMISENTGGYPKLNIEDFDDVIRLSGADLVEEIDNCYNRYGVDNTLIVCRSNKRANRFNQGIRQSILWREEELSVGDLLMVVKNNYYWLQEQQEKTSFIANGDIVEITRIGKYKELYGFRFADVSVSFLDYPDLEIDANILLDTLTSETASLSSEQNKEFFYKVLEDYSHLRTKKAKFKAVKENPYFNALQVKFSYAITCHKAQGGQWKAVFVDQGWLTDEMLNKEYLRWLYTAFTRPVEKLYLVNFKDDFFKE